MPRDLTEKTIIITGASSGIGAATAIECARAGMHVVLNARREHRLLEISRQIEQLNRKAVIVPGDVTDESNTDLLLNAARRHFGGVYSVFANAGVGLAEDAVETTDEQVREIFEINFFSGLQLLQRAARQLMHEGKPGHLFMCSSCIAKITIPRHAAYCATKAAQNHFCRAMRAELRPHGIEVASVHPVTTRTELFEVAARRSSRADGFARVPDRVPGMFVQSPRRVARAVVACLRRPKPEVWTSFTTRFGAGVLTVFPGWLDVLLRLKGIRRMFEEETPSTADRIERADEIERIEHAQR